MSQTIQDTNKALVLEAFDTLFNKRDYQAAEAYWSPNYIQHRRILLRAATAFLASSRACPQR